MKTKPNNKKKTIFIALATAVALTVALLIIPNNSSSSAEARLDEQTSALLVDTLTLNNDYMAIESEFAGTIISKNTVNVISTATGMVEEVYITPGTYVEEGTELFKINDDAAQLSLDKAEAAYNQAAMTVEASITTAERGVITAESSQNTLTIQRDNTNEELQAVVDTAQTALNTVNAAKPVDTPLPLEADFDANTNGTLDADEKLAFDAEVAKVNAANQAAQTAWQAQATQAQSALDKAVQARDQAYASFNSQISYASQTVANAQSSVTAATNTGNASLNSAGVSITTAQLQVEQYTVTAPISGTVDFMNVTVGGMASPSGVACSISDHENLQVQFSVSESVKDELSIGQSISVISNGNSYSATIDEIAPVASSQTKLYVIIANVYANIDELPLNTTVKVTAERGNVEDSIIVPYSALQFSADKTYVYVIKDGMATQTAVTLGEYNHENVEILDGLSENDVIITSWSESLRHGMAVSDINNQTEEAPEEIVDENN